MDDDGDGDGSPTILDSAEQQRVIDEFYRSAQRMDNIWRVMRHYSATLTVIFFRVLCCLLLFFVCTMCVFSSWLHELDGKVSKPGME